MQYNTSYNANIYSFVNNINTHDGGTHEEGVKRALTRVINNYIANTDSLKKYLNLSNEMNLLIIRHLSKNVLHIGWLISDLI